MALSLPLLAWVAASLLELGVEDTGEVSEVHTVHPPPGHYPRDPKPLVPDTTFPPGQGDVSSAAEAALWQCHHTRGEFGGKAGAF